jgi:hypothetical protein
MIRVASFIDTDQRNKLLCDNRNKTEGFNKINYSRFPVFLFQITYNLTTACRHFELRQPFY